MLTPWLLKSLVAFALIWVQMYSSSAVLGGTEYFIDCDNN